MIPTPEPKDSKRAGVIAQLGDPQRRRQALLIAFLGLVVVFLAVAGPGIADDFNLKSFFSEKFAEVLIFLGVGLLLRTYLTQVRKKHLHFVADAIIIASTVGLMVEVQHVRESYERVNIEGVWTYEVQNSNGVITHGGISTITQDRDGELLIVGRRKYKQRCGPKGCHGTERELEPIANEGLYWKTEFAILHGSERKAVDFVYSIIIDNTEFRGYCHLTPDTPGAEPSKLEGTYTHLAPGTLKGDIRFLRMPSRGKLGEQEAIEYINKNIKKSKGFMKP
jgi:hypothetical protein